MWGLFIHWSIIKVYALVVLMALVVRMQECQNVIDENDLWGRKNVTTACTYDGILVAKLIQFCEPHWWKTQWITTTFASFHLPFLQSCSCFLFPLLFHFPWIPVTHFYVNCILYERYVWVVSYTKVTVNGITAPGLAYAIFQVREILPSIGIFRQKF